MLLRASFMSGYAQLRNNPHVEGQGFEEFGRRMGVFYARRTAQSTGELLAGYFNHEDPRYRPSAQEGAWKRTRSALLSIVINKDTSGENRLALAPIAGSLGSGLVSIPLYQRNNQISDGFNRAEFTYSTYFARALLREFQPDLALFASRVLHRKH
jgi:hypothetical protein